MKSFLSAAWQFLRDGDERVFTARTCAHRDVALDRDVCRGCNCTFTYLTWLGVA